MRHPGEREVRKGKGMKKGWKLLLMLILCGTVSTVYAQDAALEAAYQRAKQLAEQGSYELAISTFEMLDGYMDSEEQIAACREAVLEEQYQEAAALKEAGNAEAARKAFEALGDYKDSAEQAAACGSSGEESYAAALALEEQGNYEAAAAAFRALGSYEDSAAHLETCKKEMEKAALGEEIDAALQQGEVQSAALLPLLRQAEALGLRAEQLQGWTTQLCDLQMREQFGEDVSYMDAELDGDGAEERIVQSEGTLQVLEKGTEGLTAEEALLVKAYGEEPASEEEAAEREALAAWLAGQPEAGEPAYVLWDAARRLCLGVLYQGEDGLRAAVKEIPGSGNEESVPVEETSPAEEEIPAETEAPETGTPEPETEAPAPETEAPAPETAEAPETEPPAPETEAAESGTEAAAETEAPETEPPAPETETPEPETAEVVMPETEVSEAGAEPEAAVEKENGTSSVMDLFKGLFGGRGQSKDGVASETVPEPETEAPVETEPPAPETEAPVETEPPVPATEAPAETEAPAPETLAETTAEKVRVISPLMGAVSASSSLDFTLFGPANLMDLNAGTAWLEGADGLGEGESIAWTFPQPVRIDGIAILPGYQGDPQSYYRNSIPAELVLNLGGTQLLCKINSDYQPDFANPSDSIKYQSFQEPFEVSYASVTIRSARAGIDLKHTGFSELFFFQYVETEGPAEETPVIRNEPLPNTVLPAETAPAPTQPQVQETLPPVRQETLTPVRKEETQPALSEYVLPDSDSRYYSESELLGMSAAELKLARNELYARHGRLFNNKELQSYFNSKSWYNGTIDPDSFDKRQEEIFNKYEKANRDLIVKLEHR